MANSVGPSYYCFIWLITSSCNFPEPTAHTPHPVAPFLSLGAPFLASLLFFRPASHLYPNDGLMIFPLEGREEELKKEVTTTVT